MLPKWGSEADERLGLVEQVEEREEGELVSQIANLDVFFTKVYDYYYARGYDCLLTEGALRMARTDFVIIFTTYLVAFVDWEALMLCHNEDCEHISLTRPNALLTLSGWMQLAMVIECTFLLYLMVLLMQFLTSLNDCRILKQTYAHMGVDEGLLQTIQWGEIVDRLVRLQSRMPLSRVGHFDHLKTIMRVMRVENYMIALFDLEVLDLSILGTPVFLTRSLDWNLKYLLNWMVNKRELHKTQDFGSDVRLLQSKIRWLAVMNLLAAPFVFCYLMIVMVFAHGAELKMSPGKVSIRHWSREALWKFREYNELRHIFENRMTKSYPLAQDYVDQFPNRLLSVVARFAVFVSGGFACVILLLSLLNYPLLLFIEVRGQNLLWWLSILTVVVVAGLSLSEDDHHDQYDAPGAMERLVAHTHYEPPGWRAAPGSLRVRNSVVALYRYHWTTFFQELASMCVTPVYLIFTLSGQADRFLEFVRDCTVTVDAVGPVCVFSTLEADGAAPSRRVRTDKPRRSLQAFRRTYPQWEPAGPGHMPQDPTGPGGLAQQDSLNPLISEEDL